MPVTTTITWTGRPGLRTRYALTADVIAATGLDIGSLDQARVDAVADFARRAPLSAIKIGSTASGIEIEDGRHRLALAAQLGEEFVAIANDPDDCQLAYYLGTVE